MDTYEFPPGDACLRPLGVRAAVARTRVLREEERALELCTMVAVQRDACVPLTCAAVLRDAPRQLGILEHELSVEGLRKATFLLRFRSSELRNAALRTKAIQVGRCVLSVTPWSRRIGASVGKLRFRARVCLEGVPRNARNAAAVAQLFANPSFIDEVVCPVEKEEERFCFNIWVWIDAPNDLALKGTLQLEEPVVLSDEYCFAMGDMDMEVPPVRDDPVQTLDYDVLIHLDRVLDYTPLPDSSSRIPFDDPPAYEYPASFDFTWHLGFKDGDVPQHVPSVHDRLGGCGDHPPPRGGEGSGGRGFQQQPPGTWCRGQP
jgi:hypothetical protein